MIHAYIGRNRKLYLKPTDEEGEQELKDFVQNLKQLGLEAIDIEPEMSEEQYQQQKQQRSRGEYSGSKSFGFDPQSRYPMPPDFSPQMHYYPPVILPLWFGQGGGGSGGGSGGSGGGSGGGNGGGGSGGGQGGGGGSAMFDTIERYERGRGGSRGEYGNENPRDTGRGDSPRR